MGLLTQNDATVFRGFFREMARLRGIPCEYRYVVSQEVSIHSEFKYELSDPVPMDIIFNENPTVHTLRKIGWVSENSDDKPYIAQLPYGAKNLKVGCTISITDFELNSTRDFKITTMHSLLEFPDSWTCTLAPIFFTNDAKTEYVVTNYNYLNTPDADINNDAPNNTFGKDDDDSTSRDSENFSFLNVK